jgi:acetyl esterase/lipase
MKRLLLSVSLCCFVTATWAGQPKTADTFDVEIVKGLAYRDAAVDGADPVRNQLDLYLPMGQKNFPVMIFVHGGTWKSGNKDLYAALGKLYAKHGVGTVIINYRLSPKVQHPAHIQDVARAFAWTHDNIAKHGGDPDNIFVCGHSAGGHLVTLLSTNETYVKAENLSLGNIKGTIAISGVHVLVPNALFKPIFTDDKAMVKSASPIEHVAGKHPPCLLIYADKDLLTLDVQAEQMCKKLTDCQCEARTVKIADRTHISIITSMVNEADPANQAIFEFLGKYGGLRLGDSK